MISVWRITKRKHAKTAFTGEGARLYGGRWNSPGRPIVYTADSRALALAEIVVHLESAAVLETYVVFRVEIEESLIANLEPSSLPRNWRAEPIPKRVTNLGDTWLASGATAVLRVPSAIVAGEFNYLLNPAHPDFTKLEIHAPESFRIDKRFGK